MDWLVIISTPLVTALIGWLTNRVAIRMLFRPRRPWKFLFWTWQGIIPHRQAEIGEKAGEIVQEQLLSQHVLHEEIKRIDLSHYVGEYATRLVWDRIGPRLRKVPVMGSFVKDRLLFNLTMIAIEEMNRELDPMLDKFASEAEEHIDIRRIVRDRVASLDLEELEAVVYRLAGREFRSIEIAGAVLGFAVGLLQLLLLLAIGAIELPV